MTSSRSRRLAVLASGHGSNLRALADADRAGTLGGSIVLVMSDRPDCGAGAIARARGLPVETPGTGPFRTKLDADTELHWIERLRAHGVDTVLLAGFMRVLHAPFLDAFPDRVLNIHPSLLPAFPGVDAIGQAWRHGAGITGCTVHVVTRGIDEGPILMQSAVPVLDDDSIATLTERVHAAEHVLYPRAVQHFLTRPFAVEGRRVRWLAPESA
ncbi:MAG: phosphoribosylglycinamide formyltransferase [Candidatus Eisenbacteria bacterium]